jgi:hypothetical protein
MVTKNAHGYDDLMIGFSIVAVIFSLLDSGGYNVYLSATTWLAIAAVLGIWGIYARIEKKPKI